MEFQIVTTGARRALLPAALFCMTLGADTAHAQPHKHELRVIRAGSAQSNSQVEIVATSELEALKQEMSEFAEKLSGSLVESDRELRALMHANISELYWR